LVHDGKAAARRPFLLLRRNRVDFIVPWVHAFAQTNNEGEKP
jgi:hypothetical protein